MSKAILVTKVFNFLCFIKSLMIGIVINAPSIVRHKTKILKIKLSQKVISDLVAKLSSYVIWSEIWDGILYISYCNHD